MYDPSFQSVNFKNIKWNVDLDDFFKNTNHSPDENYVVKIETGTINLTSAIPSCLVEASKWNISLQINLDSNGTPWHFNILAPANSCSDTVNVRGHRVSKPKLKVELARAKFPHRPILTKQPDTPQPSSSQQGKNPSKNRYW